jgi:hypothetical protein
LSLDFIWLSITLNQQPGKGKPTIEYIKKHVAQSKNNTVKLYCGDKGLARQPLPTRPAPYDI